MLERVLLRCFQSTQLCLVFIITCHICTMVAITIRAIHQIRSARPVCPDNLRAISALTHPILSFTICQSPANNFLCGGTMVSVCSTGHHFQCFLGVLPVLRCLLLINALAISCLECRLSILGLFKKYVAMFWTFTMVIANNSVWPMHCHPSFLHTQQVHSITIVIFNHITIAVVVVDNFWVPECCYMLDSIDHVVSFFVNKFCQSTVSCHYHHDIIMVLHTNNVELHIVQFSLQSI